MVNTLLTMYRIEQKLEISVVSFSTFRRYISGLPVVVYEIRRIYRDKLFNCISALIMRLKRHQVFRIFISQLALVFISFDSVDSVVPGTHSRALLIVEAAESTPIQDTNYCLSSDGMCLMGVNWS